MSRFSRSADTIRTKQTLRRDETITNFMGGDSYKFNPLDTLKMISASSIFAEPAYYRDTSITYQSICVRNNVKKYLGDMRLFGFMVDDKTTDKVMEDAIDAALSYDFEETLKWAVELRKEYNMRLNPQVIIARAAVHPDRAKFTASHHPGAFRKYAMDCMARADDPLNGIAYYIHMNGSKHNMPSILKRSYADKLNSLNAYQLKKYKNSGIGMIDSVRITHANSPLIDELMTTGDVSVDGSEKTWEQMRSQGKSWKEIYSTIKMGHMAMLRNLRGFFSEVDDRSICQAYLRELKNGVLTGKQFPFRYYSAYKAIEKADGIFHKQAVLDALEECVDIAVANMPKLKGKTMALSDNSGSAWGTINSEYGSVTIAEIDNLSAVLIAACSDEGYVGVFGDRLIIHPISKRNELLKQAMEISSNYGRDVGRNTEGGIWEFFDKAMSRHEHWDNIFIFSDQQAGTCSLYGTDKQAYYYKGRYDVSDSYIPYINVFKLVLDYRARVNKRVNVFSVQTAGYDNSVLPEHAYRTSLLYGWTGKEALFADSIIKLWDEVESRKNYRF